MTKEELIDFINTNYPSLKFLDLSSGCEDFFEFRHDCSNTKLKLLKPLVLEWCDDQVKFFKWHYYVDWDIITASKVNSKNLTIEGLDKALQRYFRTFNNVLIGKKYIKMKERLKKLREDF